MMSHLALKLSKNALGLKRKYIKTCLSLLFYLEYESVGCFKDEDTRAINGASKEFAVESIKNCYLKAKEEGNMFFAVENVTECFTSPDAGETYNRYGDTTGCVAGRGGDSKMNVYKLLGMYIKNII